jgi:4-carboxymuconolactone decarboxylase
MPDKSATSRPAFADIAPALATYTEDVLFGDVWKRPELSPPFHFKFALQNGVTKDELVEAITHLAFYSGWPTANTALSILRSALPEPTD